MDGRAAESERERESRPIILPSQIRVMIHIALILSVSITVLLLSLILDTLCAPLPPVVQFIVQIPLLVLMVDALRRAALARATTIGLSKDEINASFFFAAPLAAFGAMTLFGDLRRLLKR